MKMKHSHSGLFFYLNQKNSPNGITDRFKAIVGLYYIAKQNGLDFHLIHRAGFDLRDYLRPNKVQWEAGLVDILNVPWKLRRYNYLPPFDGVPVLESGFTYVCKHYVGKNNIESMDLPDWQDLWRKLFLELFTPGEAVLDALSEARMPEHYTAVNARFVNSLGTFETTDYNAPLPEDAQRALIEAVLQKVSECENASNAPVVVSSDSARFLKVASESGFRTIDREGIGHIMNPGAGELVALKTFVNFYLLARAEKVYSILNVDGFPSNSLYKTQYPRYAAIVGGKPFERV